MKQVSIARRSLAISMTFALATTPFAIAGAQELNGKSAVAVRDAFVADMKSVHTKILGLANAIPEDKYGWKPVPEVRTVANAFMHVAVEWYFGPPMIGGGKTPAEFPDLAKANEELLAVSAKKDVIAHLEKSFAYGMAQLTSASDSQLVAAGLPGSNPPVRFHQGAFLLAGDLNQHLGQLITYARVLGVKPPWAR
jgi:hypothetical protein